MKILIKPNTSIKNYLDIKTIDGVLLPLDGYSTDYDKYFTLDDISFVKHKTKLEVFVVLNRMFFNRDIDRLKELLLNLESLELSGIFFYDLAVLQLARTLKLKTPLVWNNTHMVTNTETCNYYFKKGVKYAVLSNEITFKEMIEIYDKSDITLMFPLLLYPTVANSYRHLITNYDKVYKTSSARHLKIEERVTKENYLVFENSFGTTFKYGKVLNNTSIFAKLKSIDFPYVILQEDFIEHDKFKQILSILKNDEDVSKIDDLIGNNTGFLEKETIYKVKKNG